jgi:uncharacterized protein YjhX (UPF0386 family)
MCGMLTTNNIDLSVIICPRMLRTTVIYWQVLLSNNHSDIPRQTQGSSDARVTCLTGTYNFDDCHTTLDRSGHRAPHISLRFFARLRGQSAVISSDQGSFRVSQSTTISPFTAPAFLILTMHRLLLFPREPVAAHPL